MTPLNYLRRAIQGCSEHQIPNATDGYLEKVKQVFAGCKEAVKFILPDNGKIFDDKLRGLPSDFCLPYGLLMIEYFCSNEDGIASEMLGSEVTHAARERIVLAQQDGDSILVFSIIRMEVRSESIWYLQPFCAEVLRADSVGPADLSAAMSEDVSRLTSAGATLTGIALVRHYDLGGAAQRTFGAQWEDHARYDMLDEVSAVLELIEALSCSNVGHEVLPARKLNKSAEKRGALPFDQYHVLTVRSSVAGANGIPTVLPYDRRAPREHLRRGHIRRLADGRRLWINATVVNSGTVGRISKAYRVSPPDQPKRTVT